METTGNNAAAKAVLSSLEHNVR
ncbi:MAG: hypothetical protein JWN41_1481, partial [Thermoleophilia bacterium]|nr:hypothetical protein [Thermoleophilia bacterium]